MSGAGGVAAYGDMGGFGGFDQNKGESEKKTKNKKHIPTSVKQLNDAQKHESDSYLIDGVEMSTVKLMGTMLGKEEHATNVKFFVNDGSGIMECKQWVDKEGGMTRLQNMSDGCMIGVCGNLRDYDGVKHIQVFDARPVENFNEITHHILDVILTHCQSTKGPIPGSAAAAGSKVGGIEQQTPMRMGAGQMMMSGDRGGQIKNEGEGSLLEQVHSVYKKCGQQFGMHYDQAIQMLRHEGVSITRQQLEQEVSKLETDGRLYTTTDEEHHMTTETAD